jgi:two-component system, OmpR family, response regulator
MKRLLLVDDDRELGEMLAEYLELEGFAATVVLDDDTGVREALSGRNAIVVLDVMYAGITRCPPVRFIGNFAYSELLFS